MPGLPGKEVGAVALISVAAVAAGCYLVFKVSVKLGWVCGLTFILELQI